MLLVALQVAYDDQEKVAYLISDTKLYVIDLSPEALLEGGAPATTPRELPVLRTVTLPTTATDVAFCGGYIAVSAEGSSKVLPGSVAIFSRYLRQQPSSSEGRSAGTGTGAARSPGGSLEQLTQLTVGKCCCSQWDQEQNACRGHLPGSGRYQKQL